MSEININLKVSNVKNLNDFQRAKKISIKIFKDLYNLIISIIKFQSKLNECDSNHELLSKGEFISDYLDNSSRTISILERNQMKCSFFGRTSNGKSSVINAILGKKILPCGIGHTTNCFLQIQGTPENQGFILRNRADDIENNSCKMDTLSNSQRLPVHSVFELSHALSLEKVSKQTLINIYWPYINCKMLKNDVIMLDSPGIDVDPDVDYWIDHHCLDSDVFVLVVNSESTLTQTEKTFFQKVREKVSKPNVFILNNRWDMCDKEENLVEVKKQHQKRCLDFLTKELDISQNNEVSERIYFVSAKEILEFRTNTSFNKENKPNFQERYDDFVKFEKHLEQTLCESALKTKFSGHIMHGLELVNNIISIIMEVNGQLSLNLRSKTESKLDQIVLIRKIKSNVVSTNASVNKYINTVIETIRLKVEESLKLEIKHLKIIVNDFTAPFNSDASHLLIYKTELNNFVENELDTRLSSLCSNVVKYEILKFKQFLFHEYSDLMKMEIEKSLIYNIESPNEHCISIPCNSLFSDFNEDLSFQWAFSPQSLLIKFLTISSLIRSNMVVNYSTQESQTLGRLEGFRPMLSHIYEILINKEFFGFCFVTALISKASGSRLIVSSGCSYLLLYLFEKFRWNRTTQEDFFKRQYLKYALKQLANIIDISARGYSSVIKEELQMNHKSFVRYVDNEIIRMEGEIMKLDTDITNLTEHLNSAELLRSDAESIKIDIQSFTANYF